MPPKKIAGSVYPHVGEELVNKAAEVLELSFRKQMQTKGFRNFSKIRCSVVSQKQLKPDLVEMVEECVSPDGADQLTHFMPQRVCPVGVLSIFPCPKPNMALKSTAPPPAVPRLSLALSEHFVT
ncbi:hypothetical protein [Methylobacter sp.]|uniref:hypothetical protein n=1 Tax=Methylobacter sp. TaxID=2051955 RepID=UPI0012014384|nr:hypothetical protein [Methylobacter sp.]TAK64352.1 MAG: hypothetical protein EPO18_03635 [Methylobacter sp.]